MENQKISVGRIVHYYPSEWEKGNTLAGSLNGAEFLPAICTQEFSDYMGNFIAFLPIGGTIATMSVPHKDQAFEGSSYWVYPPRV